jgi:hypothetical protein
MNFEPLCNRLKRLTGDGILGFYDHFEVTEIVAFRRGEKKPINVFSLFVAQEYARSDNATKLVWLNVERIALPSLKDWTFGVARYSLGTYELEAAIRRFGTTRQWSPSGTPLSVGSLCPIGTQFVPPDTSSRIPLNSLLKNNFWNGSYILELADLDKTDLTHFVNEPKHLADLSEAIAKVVPLGISGLSDRLGNVVIQLPVTVLVAMFRCRRNGSFFIDVAWHPRATPRHLRAICEIAFDGIVSAYASASVLDKTVDLPLQGPQHAHRGFLWDDVNQILVAATPPSTFIESIRINTYLSGGEPRTFMAPDSDGTMKSRSIGVTTKAGLRTVGDPAIAAEGGWTSKRIYSDEITRMKSERRFLQYGGKQSTNESDHESALADLRALINEHGEGGAWLWDPYLSAEDILKTLFFCTHAGADLRALTEGKELPQAPRPNHGRISFRSFLKIVFRRRVSLPSKDSRFRIQKDKLEAAKGNLRGLRLEYRAKMGTAGWGFHDRFLIFPRAQRGAIAWSLGTSVNSIGREHHILQQVVDGQMVLDAFEELWEQLDDAAYVIWKTP